MSSHFRLGCCVGKKTDHKMVELDPLNSSKSRLGAQMLSRFTGSFQVHRELPGAQGANGARMRVLRTYAYHRHSKYRRESPCFS